MRSLPFPPSEALRRAITVRRLVEHDGHVIWDAAREAGLVPAKPSGLGRLTAMLRRRYPISDWVIRRTLALPGTHVPRGPLSSDDFDRLERATLDVLARKDDAVPISDDAFSLPAVAAQIALYARIAVSSPYSIRVHMAQPVAATAGLWLALRAAGVAGNAPADYDNAARSLATLALGSQYEFPLAVDVLKTRFNPVAGLLETGASVLAATLPEQMVVSLSFYYRDPENTLGYDEKSEFYQRMKQERIAVHDAIPEKVGEALVAEDERRQNLRLAALKVARAAAAEATAKAWGCDSAAELEEIFASIRAIVNDETPGEENDRAEDAPAP